jgi:hypothetical protein
MSEPTTARAVLAGALDGAVERQAGLLVGEDVTPAEISVAALGALMSTFLGWVCADPKHPAFLPGSGYHQHTGTPNPDTVYLTAAIDGSATYRITGARGTAPEVTVMPMGAPGPNGIATYPAFDLDQIQPRADGQVDVIVSAERPEGHEGNWWQIDREVRTLMVRSVSDNWGAHRDPVLAIIRLDRPSRRVRTAQATLEARLAAVAPVVEGSLGFGVRKVLGLRSAGVVNAVTLVDYSAGGGLPGQWYHEGLYELAEDDALVLEADLRGGHTGFSLALTDGMACALDWANAQTSLNRTQATVDDDGVLRAVVARQDPGVAQWLDTMGHPTGLLQLRWMGSTGPPPVALRRVPTVDVAAHLPAGTRFVRPDQREAELRRRAVGAQLRTLW